MAWEEMTGMRNNLIHDHFGVELEVVWRTVQEDLPPLGAATARMLAYVSSRDRLSLQSKWRGGD